MVNRISTKQKDKLKANWGEKADSLNCFAEMRVFDPLSCWCCYIYALNPEDEDEISCIIKGFTIEVGNWRLSEMAYNYNAEGEPLQVDEEFRPRLASEIFKQLNER